VRGYKEKFLQAIQIHADEQIVETKQAFLEDSSKLEKSLRWYFNDLNAVKQGMVPLMPKKWKILKTYAKIYHKVMHDFLVGMIDDPDTSSANMLAIVNWPEKYYAKMKKLGFSEEELVPPVIDEESLNWFASSGNLSFTSLMNGWTGYPQRRRRISLREMSRVQI